MTKWWILIAPDGGIRQVSSCAGEDVDGCEVIEVDRRGDLSTEVWDRQDARWIDDMPAVSARAVASIDERREQEQLKLLTTGTAKAMVYAIKAGEADRFRALGADGVSAMSAEDAAAAFPAAAAEAVRSGESLIDVLRRISDAVLEVNGEVFRIDAIATVAKAQVRASTERGQVDAIMASIPWVGDADAGE